MYEVIRVQRRCGRGMTVTKETVLTMTATMDDVLKLAAKQGADPESIGTDLEELGCATFHGYMIFER